MFQTVEEFLIWLRNHNKFSMKLHLTRIEKACDLLGNPEKKVKTIHIAGTNGKGSTCNYLRHMLVASNFKVGLYISPYIMVFNERIQINNEYISNEDLLKCANVIVPVVNEVEKELNDDMTEFEIITLLAFYYFNLMKVDYAIFEVGLGGRYDATNLINPIVAGITNISYDHMGVLGNTLEEIAYEKIGIAKEGLKIFTTEINESVLTVFKDYSKRVGASLESVNNHDITNYKYTDEGMNFIYQPINKELFIPMMGVHQLKNVNLALKIYNFLIKKRKLSINSEYIYNGLKNSVWIGRLEKISKEPFILIDGSHNIDGIKALVESMKYYIDKDYKINIVFAALKDKDTTSMIQLLQSISNRLTFTSFNYYRANSAVNLCNQSSKEDNVYYNEDFKSVLDNERRKTKENELLLITGSLYFISEVKKYFISI